MRHHSRRVVTHGFSNRGLPGTLSEAYIDGTAFLSIPFAPIHPFFKAVIFLPNSKARIFGDARQVSLSSLIVSVKRFNDFCLQSIISFAFCKWFWRGGRGAVWHLTKCLTPLLNYHLSHLYIRVQRGRRSPFSEDTPSRYHLQSDSRTLKL